MSFEITIEESEIKHSNLVSEVYKFNLYFNRPFCGIKANCQAQIRRDRGYREIYSRV